MILRSGLILVKCLDHWRQMQFNQVFNMHWILLLLTLIYFQPCQSWTNNIPPNVALSYSQSVIAHEVQRFGGNETDPDYFRLLLTEDDSMLVGAKNVVYNISMATLIEHKKIKWNPSNDIVENCKRKMKTVDQCQNYVRVIAKKSSQDLLICGTNAFKPTCRTYRYNYDTAYHYVQVAEEESVGVVPYDPNHNSTAVYAGGRLYSGTVSDITGRDPLIYREPLRTTQHNSMLLNEPDFVNSFEYGDKIYYFLRETAVEYINCGKSVFSRVARICKNDNGHRYIMKDQWTSFFKARLNCSIPGEFPFYFNEIQSTSKIGRGNYMPSLLYNNRTDMVYAVFSTPVNSISGSAVCAFRFTDIINAFEGNFKEQKSTEHKWMVSKKKVSTKCVNDTNHHDAQHLDFVKKHPLMDTSVPSYGGSPLVVTSGLGARYTQVAVDWQVLAADRQYYDVLFIGTDDGRVIKSINKGKTSRIETVIIEDIQVFENKAPIVGLKVYKNLHNGLEKLIVFSRDEIKSIPLHRCHLRKSCGSCIALQDPYCSWAENRCVNSNTGIQSIESGYHPSCPSTPVHTPRVDVTQTTTPCQPCQPCICPGPGNGIQTKPPIPTTVPLFTNPPRNTNSGIDIGDSNEIPTPNSRPTGNIDDNKIPTIVDTGKEAQTGASRMSEDRVYSVLHMAIAVVLSIVLSLVIGFLIGYRVSICRRSRFRSSNTPYLDGRLGNADICKNQKAETSQYVNCNDSGFMEVQKQLNVVLNIPTKGTNNLPNGSAETKVQPQKVKKVYL